MFKKLEDAFEYAPVPLRVGLAILFGFSGINKLMDPAGTSQFFGSLGFPLPDIMVWVAVAIEVIGALFLLLGFATRLTAIVLTVFLAIATTTAYIIPWDPSKLMMLVIHAPLIGATLSLIFSGPGAWSVDERILWE